MIQHMPLNYSHSWNLIDTKPSFPFSLNFLISFRNLPSSYSVHFLQFIAKNGLPDVNIFGEHGNIKTCYVVTEFPIQ